MIYPRRSEIKFCGPIKVCMHAKIRLPVERRTVNKYERNLSHSSLLQYAADVAADQVVAAHTAQADREIPGTIYSWS